MCYVCLIVIGCLWAGISVRWKLKVFSSLFWACTSPWACVVLSKFSCICGCFWISSSLNVWLPKGEKEKNEGEKSASPLNPKKSVYSEGDWLTAVVWGVQQWLPVSVSASPQSEAAVSKQSTNPSYLEDRFLNVHAVSCKLHARLLQPACSRNMWIADCHRTRKWGMDNHYYANN